VLPAACHALSARGTPRSSELWARGCCSTEYYRAQAEAGNSPIGFNQIDRKLLSGAYASFADFGADVEHVLLDPGVATPANGFRGMLRPNEEVMREAGLQVKPELILKAVHLHETPDVRFGVVLVGPTGGGKSSCLCTLSATTRLRESGDARLELRTGCACTLNPTCITMGELYGEVNASVEREGGLTHRAMASQTTERNREVFDGPADAIWIEHMSTVLDDNTCTFFLPRGEHGKLGGELMQKASRSSPSMHGASGHAKSAEAANGTDDIIQAPRQTHIWVRMPHGTAMLPVEPGASVAAVKARLAARVAIPVYEQRLLLAGRQLRDDDILGSEPTLHLNLMLRLCGGMDGASFAHIIDSLALDPIHLTNEIITTMISEMDREMVIFYLKSLKVKGKYAEKLTDATLAMRQVKYYPSMSYYPPYISTCFISVCDAHS
jgi:hypothetical protein